MPWFRNSLVNKAIVDIRLHPGLMLVSTGLVWVYAVLRVATFSLLQSGTGIWWPSPQPMKGPGIAPGKLLEFCIWLVQFDAVWWQLFVGCRARYIHNIAIKIELICQLQCPHGCTGWLGSRVVSVLDSGAVGPGFKSHSWHCRVTVLGKLFTSIVPLFTKQWNW